MSRIIPEEYAVTIARWPAITIGDEVHHIRAVRPLKPFSGLGEPWGGLSSWLTEEDWDFVKDGSDRPILLIGHSGGKDIVMTGLFSIPGSPNGNFPTIVPGDNSNPPDWYNPFYLSVWVDVLGLGEPSDQYWEELYAFSGSAVVSDMETKKKLLFETHPVMVFDVSMYKMLGVELPYLMAQDSFEAWLEEIRGQ